jgi:hypothetical protein
MKYGKILFSLLLTFLIFPILSFGGQNKKTGWNYESINNQMTDETFRVAWVVSKNKHKFSFPYGGGTSASLFIREKEGKTDVIVMIDKGQFVCHDPCRISMRFDDAPVEDHFASGPADGSTNTIFFKRAEELAKEIARSRR